MTTEKWLLVVVIVFGLCLFGAWTRKIAKEGTSLTVVIGGVILVAAIMLVALKSLGLIDMVVEFYR